MDKVHSVQELIERTKDMPLEKMRFFINQDKKEPRCFGIYQDSDTGRWVVYKNKDNGSRAVRYDGPDEAYAAQELWAKINSEIELRRAKRPVKRSHAEIVRERIRKVVIALLIAAIAFLFLRWISRMPDRGYYIVDDDVYYHQDSDWYAFVDGAWLIYDEPVDYDWYNGHYFGETYPYFDSYDEAFEYSDYYEEPSSNSNDRDSDNDYSDIFDSWDSSDTDWSSDW